ncbi:hypothetical protein NDU88_005498 [Pleurodeles waltl]|uniref:Uncharacterized protein n=1 Tax=Pleurodeles waltl TaxID=8319 RepID=A0AAV7VND4_PLEWA|nr:hypothetical protein NDU88_005498 [Pleurodeles waltl]
MVPLPGSNMSNGIRHKEVSALVVGPRTELRKQPPYRAFFDGRSQQEQDQGRTPEATRTVGKENAEESSVMESSRLKDSHKDREWHGTETEAGARSCQELGSIPCTPCSLKEEDTEVPTAAS